MSATLLNHLPSELFGEDPFRTDDEYFYGRKRQHHPNAPTREEVAHFVFDSRYDRQLRFAISQKKPIFAKGPTGTAKTLFGRWFAHQLGLPFRMIPFNGQIELESMLSVPYQDANGKWCQRDGHLVEGYVQGGVVMLDEIPSAKASVLQGLHPWLDQPTLTLPARDAGQMLQRSSDLFFIGTGNDWRTTVGNYEPGEPLLRRFLCIEFDYLNPGDEVPLITRQSGLESAVASRLVAFAGVVRAANKSNAENMPATCPTSTLIDAGKYMTVVDASIEEAFEEVILPPITAKWPEIGETIKKLAQGHVSPQIGKARP